MGHGVLRLPEHLRGALASDGRVENVLRDARRLSLIELAPKLYRERWVSKVRGRPRAGRRRVDTPCDDLKCVQKEIGGILAPLVASPIVHGIRGKTAHAAALVHQRERYVGKADIRRFFQSIGGQHVRELLVHLGLSADATDDLLSLTLYRGSLPPGAPSSHAIKDLVLAGVDERLHDEARRLSVNLTRYCDDLGISGPNRGAVAAMDEFVARELSHVGFALHSPGSGKRWIRGKNRPQNVLGENVTHGAAITKQWRRNLVRDVEMFLRHGGEAADLNRLRGRAGRLAAVPRHRPESRRLLARLRPVDSRAD